MGILCIQDTYHDSHLAKVLTKGKRNERTF